MDAIEMAIGNEGTSCAHFLIGERQISMLSDIVPSKVS